jgi:hypothetical protein
MNFTPKKMLGAALGVTLALAPGECIAWGGQAANGHHALTMEAPVVSAVDAAPASNSYLPVTAWYKNKQWWKRNAPIIGGAGGGALVGGLLGGGKGALIGGAVGGGGGYLYKRAKRNHDYHEYHHHQ